MKFDWNKFVSLCHSLAQGNGDREALLRTAISRGYYGVFNLVRTALQSEGHTFSSGADVHQEVIQVLNASQDNARRKLGHALRSLRTYRNQADYNDAIDNVAAAHNCVAVILEKLKPSLSQLCRRI